MRVKIAQSYFEKPAVAGLKARAVKGGGVNIAAEILSFVVRTAGLIVLARLLEPRDFGIVTMVAVFSLLLMNFGRSGFTEFIIQKDTITHAEMSSIFWVHALISLALMSALIAAGPLLAAFYHEPALRSVSAVMASGIIVQMLSTPHLALLKRRMDFGKIASNRVVAEIVSSVAAVLLALKGLGYWAVVGRQLSAVAVISIGAWFICPWRPDINGKFRTVPGSVKYALRVYGNFVLWYVSRNLDKFLLGRFYGSDVLGNYERAYYISSLPIDKLLTPLHAVGLSTLSRLRDDPDRFVNYYRKALSTLAFFGVLISVILVLAGKDLVVLVLGPGWETAGAVVTVLGASTGAVMLHHTQSWIHLSLGKPHRLMRWSIISLSVIAGAVAASAPFGPVYVAGAYSIAYYILMFPAVWYAGRPIALRASVIADSVWRYFAAGGAVCAVGLTVPEFSRAASVLGDLQPYLRVLLFVPSSIVVYAGLVVALHRSVDPLRNLCSLARLLVARERPASSNADQGQ